MYVVIVEGREYSEIVRVYGPFRLLSKAEEVRDLCRIPQAVEYFDDEDHRITVAKLSRYGD